MSGQSQQRLGICVVAALVVGCGPQEMPKGTGASGTLSAAVNIDAKPDFRLDIVNVLTDPDDQFSFQIMHQSFAEAATVAADLDETAKEQLQKIQSQWDDIDFLQAQEDKRIRFNVEFTTSFGNIQIVVSDSFSPSLARSLVALAISGYFDGSMIRLDGEELVLGSPDDESLYSIKPRPVVVAMHPGMLMVRSDANGKARGTQFRIAHTKAPEYDESITILGGSHDLDVLQKMRDALQKDPQAVRIDSVRVVAREERGLFSETGVKLPRFDKEGNPRSGGRETTTEEERMELKLPDDPRFHFKRR